jgi:uncharacterized membrane protein
MNDRNEGIKWLWFGLAGMFILIGTAILFDAVTGRLSGSQVAPAGYGWISNIVWGIVAIWVLTLIFWPWNRNHALGLNKWNREDEAVNIIRKRYASGEITKEQYEQMLQDFRRF